MEIDTHWDIVKKIFKQSFSSSFHFSIATVDENGKPHVTPIGSLILGNPGHAIYFEEFPNKLQNNLKTSKHVSILAVNSSKWFRHKKPQNCHKQSAHRYVTAAVWRNRRRRHIGHYLFAAG